MKAATIKLDGKTIGFAARESTFGTCEGCLFARHRSNICNEAATAAFSAGQPDCDDKAPNHGSYIYVEADARQLVLPTGEGSANAT